MSETVRPIDRSGVADAMSTGGSVRNAAGPTAAAYERVRDYPGLDPIDKLLTAAKAGRHRVRDHLRFFTMFRHGLRVSDIIALRRHHVDPASPVAGCRGWSAGLTSPISSGRLLAGGKLCLGDGRETRGALPCPFRHAALFQQGFALANRGCDLRLIQNHLGHHDPRRSARYPRTAASSSMAYGEAHVEAEGRRAD